MDLVRHIPNGVNDLSGVNAMQQQEPAIKWVPLIIGLLPIFTILCAVLFVMSNLRYYRQLQQERTAYLLEIAQQLGYAPEVHLVQSRMCWDPGIFFDQNCGVFVVFTTQMDFTNFQQTIQRLEMQTNYDADSDPGFLFDDINMSTNRRLTIDGKIGDELADTNKIQQIDTHKWSVIDHAERKLLIRFYEIAAIKAHIEIDGQRIQNNIVYIRIELGRSYFWL